MGVFCCTCTETGWICRSSVDGDYEVTVNPVIEVEKRPIPKVEDLLTVLVGGKKFSKIDLSQVYEQMVLNSEDRKYTLL